MYWVVLCSNDYVVLTVDVDEVGESVWRKPFRSSAACPVMYPSRAWLKSDSENIKSGLDKTGSPVVRTKTPIAAMQWCFRWFFRLWQGIPLCSPHFFSWNLVTFLSHFQVCWFEFDASSYFFGYTPRGAWPAHVCCHFARFTLLIEIPVFSLLHAVHCDCFEP